ncbi:hypothetical protein ACPCA8_21115 [Streptomyces capoamus]|uniref:hypothetical protein n=1 Tax=Streptomyces capoamus TaxID=68183 RepID=UPI003C2AE6FB
MAAAVLGLIAGTCAGYLVQAGREPTALPPLSQPKLARAEGGAPPPLSAAQDRKVKADGDLRALLLRKPAGAGEFRPGRATDGWTGLAELADTYGDPADGYGWLLSKEFRRAAVTGWREGTRTVQIRLIQFRQQEVLGAREAAENDDYWARQGGAADSGAIPGTGDGMAYAYRKARTEYGVRQYLARAHAWRGDIEMEIWIDDTGPVPKRAVLDLAERQMERL